MTRGGRGTTEGGCLHGGAEGAQTPAGGAGDHSPHKWGKAFANTDSWNPLLRQRFPIVSTRVSGQEGCLQGVQGAPLSGKSNITNYGILFAVAGFPLRARALYSTPGR
jgi:hypothetical protein